MARRYEVDQHPHKGRIIKALVRGKTLREITGQYGITKSALSRYLNKKLLPQAAQVAYEEGMKDGSLVWREIQEAIIRVHKMYRACDEYLKDPANPGEYFLGPRADEVRVAYREQDAEGVWHKRTEILQAILNRLHKAGKMPTDMRFEHSDPATMLLQTMSKAKEQIELLARVQQHLSEVTVNINNIAGWADIKRVILEATKGSPDVRARIIEGLKAIADA